MGTTINVRLPDPARRRVEATTADGQLIVLDADPPDGDGSGAGPKEALLAALAGCTSMDVASLLAKKRQRPTRYDLVVTGESANDHPRIFTSIVVEHRVSGAVEAEALRRSIELSATRYCPVNAMLSHATEIEHRYRLEGEGAAPEEAVVVRLGPGSTTPA